MKQHLYASFHAADLALTEQQEILKQTNFFLSLVALNGTINKKVLREYVLAIRDELEIKFPDLKVLPHKSGYKTTIILRRQL